MRLLVCINNIVIASNVLTICVRNAIPSPNKLVFCLRMVSVMKLMR